MEFQTKSEDCKKLLRDAFLIARSIQLEGHTECEIFTGP